MTGSNLSDKRRRSSVQSVERSLSIIEVMALRREPMTLGEIARLSGLKPSTTHRLLSTLVSRGFARQDVITGKYQLGLKTFQIGNAALYNLDLRSVARSYLTRLVDKCGETANLAVLSRDNNGVQLVYIDQVESPSMVHTFARIGSPVPVHCTGSGKVLLAFMEDREIDFLLKTIELQAFTERTITDPELLKEEISLIRKEGYAWDREETERGVLCIAAPVRDHTSHVVAAVSISGPVSRMKPPYEFYIECVKEASQSISQALGYSAG